MMKDNMILKPLLISAGLLLMASTVSAADFQPVTCEGTYAHHLQGVCTDENEAIFWCFTTKLVKTDRSGKVLKQIDVPNHHGDLCYREGRVYVAVNLGKFNDSKGNADSWIYVYDAADLSLLIKHATPQVIYGAGGIAFHEGRFLIVGGLPPAEKENLAYEYDLTFEFIKQHRLSTGYTLMGIQTAAFADGRWWFGCYGNPGMLLTADQSLTAGKRFEFECSLGIVPLQDGKFLIGRDKSGAEKRHTGSLILAEVDSERGLVLTK